MCFRLLTALLCLSFAADVQAEDAPLPVIKEVELQPLVAQVKRLVEALDYLGVPLAEADRQALEAAMKETDAATAAAAIQKVLDPHCLVGAQLVSDKELTAAAGSAAKKLVEQARRAYDHAREVYRRIEKESNVE